MLMLAKRSSNITLLMLAAFVCGCAAPSVIPTQPYSVLTLRDPSRHQVVDDFLRQDFKNRVGGSWRAVADATDWVTTEYVREDAVKPQGFSLEALFNVPQGGEAAVETDLNQLDASAAKAFSFWIRGDRSIQKVLSMELSNHDGEAIRLELLPRFRSGRQWQEVSLGSELAGVTLENLKSFRLIVSAKEGPVSGALYLDHVAFSGEENLNLNSLADNLYDFPAQTVDEEKQRMLLAAYDEKLLKSIAKDTWGYFLDLTDRDTHLPVDHVKLDRKAHIGDYTSPTNIGLYLMACIAAYDFKWIDVKEMTERIRGTLETLGGLPRWEGLFFNYYNTTNLQVTNHFVSSVDNAWLAASLVVVRQAVPDLAAEAGALLESMDLGKFYSEQVGHFFVGYDWDHQKFRNNHYGLLSSETRILSYVAIGKGDVEERHWFRLYRTLPEEWDWQKQVPKGQEIDLLGQPVFEGYYVFRDIPIVPSWGGALFEFLMPTLLIDEKRLAPKGLGANDTNAVRAQIVYAEEKGYPVWGFSPCAITGSPRGGYGEFGLPEIGAKGYKDGGIVTPHVTFLALPFEQGKALKNIRGFLNSFPIYGPYGFLDSVDVKRNVVCYEYLALDQAMILLALDNYFNENAISSRFHADPVGSRPEPLLAAEEFYPGFAQESEPS